jgi:hypothetical protein
MRNKITRLKATNEKSIKGNSPLCGDSFEIDIEAEFKSVKEDEDYNTDLTNFNLKL